MGFFLDRNSPGVDSSIWVDIFQDSHTGFLSFNNRSILIKSCLNIKFKVIIEIIAIFFFYNTTNGVLEKRFFNFLRKVADWTKLCIIRAIDHISFLLLSSINFFMFLLALKAFMALGAIWDNYGQVPFNKILTFFFHFQHWNYIWEL